jgi:hypothetical protein
MSYRPPVEDDKPWYRQFWPWALIALPASAVVASIATIILATSDVDGLVRDDYYKEGLAINLDLARERKARDLGLAAEVTMEAASGVLRIKLRGETARELPYLDLKLFHPTRKGHDLTLRLPATGPGEFALRHAPPPRANWRLTILPPQQDWRLKGRLDFPAESGVTIR